MENYLEALVDILAMEQLNPVTLLLAACGMLCCFFGYRTTRLLLDAAGFVAVGLAAVLVAGHVSDGNLLIMLVAMGVGGLIGLLLVRFAYRAGLVLFGGGLSALMAWYYAEIFLEGATIWIAVAIAAVVGGIASYLLERFTLSMVTAALGAWFTVQGVFLLLEAMEVTPAHPETGERLAHLSTVALAWIGLTAVGFSFQIIAGGRKKAAGQ